MMKKMRTLALVAATVFWLAAAAPAAGQDYGDCLDCHGDKYLETRAGRSAYVDEAVFRASAHGAAGLACTDCHTALKGEESGPHIYPLRAAECASCHPAETASYKASFHGKAAAFGRSRAARCTSCHGLHDIKPFTDSASRTYPANLAKTCGSCHPGAGTHVARGKIHVLAARKDSPGAYIVRVFYSIVIAGLMAAFLVFIGSDLFRRGRNREKR